MFDTAHKGAASALAAVIVMLERREAEAREAYNRTGRRLRGRTLAYIANMSANEFTAEQTAHDCAHARWYGAQSALTVVRELTSDL